MKSKLNYIITCDSAFYSENKTPNAIGVFDVIYSDKFPTVHPKFSIFSSFSGDKGEYKYKTVIEKEGRVIISMESKNVEIKRDGGKTNMINNIVGMRFEEVGIYDIKVYINDKLQDISEKITLEEKR